MKNTLLNIWNFYLEGFRSMTLGRTLWLIILVKLFIMFFILKIFFFPNLATNLPVTGIARNVPTIGSNPAKLNSPGAWK